MHGKAGGGSGILEEMVKSACCDCDFLDPLLDLVHTSWMEQRVPKERSDAVIVPIPKKGNLTNCDNWRGIALLDVVGKVAARIIQHHGLSAEREIRRGISASQSDRSLSTSSRERHSASLAADGFIVVVAMLCTGADRIQAECQYLRALRFCSPPPLCGGCVAA